MAKKKHGSCFFLFVIRNGHNKGYQHVGAEKVHVVKRQHAGPETFRACRLAHQANSFFLVARR